MALKGKIKYSKSQSANYDTENFSGDVNSLYFRLSQIGLMYPNSKQIFFYFHTQDNIISGVKDDKKITWFAKAIVPSDTGIVTFKGTSVVRNGSYSVNIVVGSTADIVT